MDGQKAHPLLAQVPLIVSPFYNPPKAVTLPFNYKPLPQTVAATNVTHDNLGSWIAECNRVKSELEGFGSQEVKEYKEWEKNVIRKLAPGYLGESSTHLLTPQRKIVTPPAVTKKPSQAESTNDIDRVFISLNIN